MKQLTKILYLFLVFFSFISVVFGKIHPLGRKFIFTKNNQNYINGDLYDFAELASFKTKIPTKTTLENTNLSDAKIFTVGDSFFQVAFESENFAGQLEDQLKLSVYNVVQASDDFLQVANPLIFLNENQIQKNQKKILILESTDWRSLARAKNYTKDNFVTKNESSKYNTYIFKNSDIEYFVRNNLVIYPARIWAKNWLFENFNQIDSRIGAYNKKSKMLFYFEEVNFNKRKKTDQEIELAAGNIAELSKILKDSYNITLLYINMPDKFSIYGNLADPQFSYDNFSTHLNQALEKKGVNSIDAYKILSDYKKSHPQDLLYYPTDSHYTDLGKGLVVSAAAKAITDLKSKP